MPIGRKNLEIQLEYNIGGAIIGEFARKIVFDWWVGEICRRGFINNWWCFRKNELRVGCRSVEAEHGIVMMQGCH